jgi:mRNA-decapping enzyme subunit 2
MEETGLDISGMVEESEFIESVINDQINRLYLVTGVPHSTKYVCYSNIKIDTL